MAQSGDVIKLREERLCCTTSSGVPRVLLVNDVPKQMSSVIKILNDLGMIVEVATSLHEALSAVARFSHASERPEYNQVSHILPKDHSDV
jgi:PleD family two-component response regulator